MFQNSTENIAECELITTGANNDLAMYEDILPGLKGSAAGEITCPEHNSHRKRETKDIWTVIYLGKSRKVFALIF